MEVGWKMGHFNPEHWAGIEAAWSKRDKGRVQLWVAWCVESLLPCSRAWALHWRSEEAVRGPCLGDRTAQGEADSK